MPVIPHTFPFLGACVFVFGGLVWLLLTRSSPPPATSSSAVSKQDENGRMLMDLARMPCYSEPAFRLLHLVSIDGAGAWPPRCNHQSWPAALLPYRDVYLELNHLLPVADASLGDETNQNRRLRFRGLMRQLLSDRVNLAEVEKVLLAAEKGDWDAFTLDAYNGFYCAVAVSRHAYRWAMVPVIKAAQAETTVDLPPELEVPWRYLQRHFGCGADAGNITSNAVHNFDEKGQLVYQVNVGMSSLIQSSEDTFLRIFHDVEVLAFPMYCEMVHALTSYATGRRDACQKHLEGVNGHLRALLRVFHARMHDGRIARAVWLSHVQGFQGWGVGRAGSDDDADGGPEPVRHDGLSGNQVLAFQAVDAFLGLDAYLTGDALALYVPRRQRDLCAALRTHALRPRLRAPQDASLMAEFAKIVNQMRVFRAAHRTRAMPYLRQPAPERLPMTAGKSVLTHSEKKEDLDKALAVLDGLLEKRFNQTV